MGGSFFGYVIFEVGIGYTNFIRDGIVTQNSKCMSTIIKFLMSCHLIFRPRKVWFLRKNIDVKTFQKSTDVISMTVYRPTKSSSLLPLLPGAVFIHGGGISLCLFHLQVSTSWGMASFTGKEEHYDAQCRILASLGCVVFCLHFTNSYTNTSNIHRIIFRWELRKCFLLL